MSEYLAVEVTIFVEVADDISEVEMDKIAADLEDSVACLDGVADASAGVARLAAG